MDKYKNKIDNNFHWIFYGRKFFCNNIDLKRMKIMKDYLKENKF